MCILFFVSRAAQRALWNGRVVVMLQCDVLANYDEALATIWRNDILQKFWRKPSEVLVTIWRMSDDKLWRMNYRIMPEFWAGNIWRTSGEIPAKRVKQGEARRKPQLSLAAEGAP